VAFYLLKEDGGKIQLEDLSGSILLEADAVPGPSVDWQAGGAGYPAKHKKRRNETEELFRKIEHSLEVALGLAEEPLEVGAEAVTQEAAPAWSEERYLDAIRELGLRRRDVELSSARFERLQAMLRAYQEAQERERIEEEEAWILMA
jgi:hypothetical protein